MNKLNNIKFNNESFPKTIDILNSSPIYDAKEKKYKINLIKKLLKKKDAKIIAHYYTHEDIQEVAELTGGKVSDSLEMAKFGANQSSKMLIVAGVRFMGETAKILNPEKKVLMPTLDAECSLDLNCPASGLLEFSKKYPDRENVKRLVKNFNPKKVYEILPTSEYTAYSENKGEKLAFCTTTKKYNNNLISPETLLFVGIHELSHIATKSVGHKPEFWSNFKFLLQNAKEAKIHQPIDYAKKPQKYCGMTISDNPYYDY